MYKRYNSSRPTGGARRQPAPREAEQRPRAPREQPGGDFAAAAREHERKAENYISREPERAPGGSAETGFLDSILNMLPNELYNRNTKKILGLVTAEDLLLASLILLVADSGEKDSAALILALLYILASKAAPAKM